jgi:polar amino acid transport system substrate-binding protein
MQASSATAAARILQEQAVEAAAIGHVIPRRFPWYRDRIEVSLPTESFTMRIVLAFAIALVSALSVASEPIRVGMELSYPPFEMTDRSGKPEGVSVRLAEALAKDLGRDLVIENIAFDGLIPALKTKKIDCIISSMTATPERARSIAFSEPYMKTSLGVLAGAKSPVTSVADLDVTGRVVAVKKGTTGHHYAATNIKNARLLVLDKESAAVMEVAQGRADAFVYDAFSVYRSHVRHPETTRALLAPFREESWAIGLRRGDDALRTQVNAFLNRFRNEGGFERLGDEFLADEKAFFKKEGIPFVF